MGEISSTSRQTDSLLGFMAWQKNCNQHLLRSKSCPSPAPQKSRECVSSSDGKTIPLTLQSPGAGEKLTSSFCFMDAGPWEALREEFPRVLVAVMYAAVRCTAGDQTDDVILHLRT